MKPEPSKQAGAIGKSAVAGLVVASYFLLLTRSGWGSYFDRDTLLNIAYLHGYGRSPLGIIFAQALTVFTPEYRPVGGLYYRTLFAIFGLNPQPFRIAAFAILALNLVLAWRWAKALSGSGFTAAVATLLFSFHPAMSELYFRDGVIYDILCVAFLLPALIEYVRVRQGNGMLTTTNLLIVLALQGAALGSKEMAVTLPGILILYEAVFHPHWRGFRRRATPILVVGMMTALCMVWKTMVPNAMSTNIAQGYTPHYGLAFIGSQYLHYYRQLWLAPALRGVGLWIILLAALAAAVALRNRLMLFGFLFANLTLLPVCVIPPRPGFVWYLPILGWALYGASVISSLSSGLAAWARQRVHAGWLAADTPLQGVFFAALAIGSYLGYAPLASSASAALVPEQRSLRDLLTAARSASPALPRGSRIQLESNPSDPTDLIPVFLFRLAYRDATLWVDNVPHVESHEAPNNTGLYAMTIQLTPVGYRAATHQYSNDPPIPVAVAPAIVHRGETIRVRFPPGFAGCAMEAAYRMPEDELRRAGVWRSWLKLDAQAQGTTQVDRDAERGSVLIDRVRACEGAWIPATGRFVIIP